MEATDGFPGASGRIPDKCATVSHVLQDDGYSTFWVGKDHNVPEEDNAPGGNRSMWPLQLGFDRFYGFLGGETNNWYPDLVEDNHFIEPPYRPEEGYHRGALPGVGHKPASTSRTAAARSSSNGRSARSPSSTADARR